MPVEMDIASEYRYRNPVVGARRPGDRHHPVGRDRRHPGGDAARPRERAPRCWRSPTSWAARRPATPTPSSTPAPGSRSASPRPRPSSPRSRRCTCSGCGSPSCAGRCRRSALAELVAELKAHPLEDRGDARAGRGAGARRSPRRTTSSSFFLYLGRHIGLPVCLEGALKLKEISYIPTDAYAAGEMKHGPIALLDESTPVVCVATDSPVLDKVLSNVEEVRARGAETIAIATEGSEQRRRGRRRDDRGRRAPTGSCSRSSRSCRCSCSPTTSPALAASTSTSPAIWPRPSPSSNRRYDRR